MTNFLDFAKPRQPVWKMTEIVSIVDSVLGLAAHAVGRTPITFRKEMASFLPLVECDPEQLKQVLLNLTINAIQVTQPNGGEITIKAQERQQHVYIEIEDQGCGVLPEYLDKISIRSLQERMTVPASASPSHIRSCNSTAVC